MTHTLNVFRENSVFVELSFSKMTGFRKRSVPEKWPVGKLIFHQVRVDKLNLTKCPKSHSDGEWNFYINKEIKWEKASFYEFGNFHSNGLSR